MRDYPQHVIPTTSKLTIENIVKRYGQGQPELLELELQRLVLVAQKEQMIIDRDFYLGAIKEEND